MCRRPFMTDFYLGYMATENCLTGLISIMSTLRWLENGTQTSTKLKFCSSHWISPKIRIISKCNTGKSMIRSEHQHEWHKEMTRIRKTILVRLRGPLLFRRITCSTASYSNVVSKWSCSCWDAHSVMQLRRFHLYSDSAFGILWLIPVASVIILITHNPIK